MLSWHNHLGGGELGQLAAAELGLCTNVDEKLDV
jgi:hypothetical protein